MRRPSVMSVPAAIRHSSPTSQPDGYRSIVLEGSTPGFLGAKSPASPRDLAVVFGQYDEFAPLMWGVPKGSLVSQSPNLLWPADHAWFVCTEIDDYETYVGGSHELIDALAAHPDLEVERIEPDQL